MKIAVIDNFDSFVYNLIRYIKEQGVKVEVIRNDQINSEVVNQCDGILLSPGPGIPKEAGEMMNVISSYSLSKPILGICLGHQALGQFFGGQLERCEYPLHGKSSLILQNGESDLFIDLPERLEVGRYHSWRISSKLPKSLVSTATTLDGELMAFKHRELPVEGFQFHPESILTPLGRKMINNWINKLKALNNEKNN